jgi:hypothetical protein
VSNHHPKAADDGALDRDWPVELARPVSKESKVFEASKGMHLDPHQVPTSLMQAATDAGQPAAASVATAQTSASEGQPEAG